MSLDQFKQTTLQGVGSQLSNATSLQFGPDGKLYVAQQDGLIRVFTIERIGDVYNVTGFQDIVAVQNITNHNDDGSVASSNFQGDRQVTGLLVAGTAEDPILYVTSSDPRIRSLGNLGQDTNLDTNSGIISRLTQVESGSWSTLDKVDLVRGLPRSESNHSTNGMALDAATNTLYVAQGGSTNSGATSLGFSYLPEMPLSAAILTVDLSAIDAMPVQGSGSAKFVYDLPTLLGTPTPFGGQDGRNAAYAPVDSPVQVYSSGYRNAYDVVITESGRIYTVDNGANEDFGSIPVDTNGNLITDLDGDGLPDNGAIVTNDVNEVPSFGVADQLHLVTQGFYAGHPNPFRAAGADAGFYSQDAIGTLETTNIAANAGIPAEDPRQAVYKAPGSDGALLLFDSIGRSPNGIAEYTSTADPDLTGDLLTVTIAGSQRLVAIDLNADGTAVDSVQMRSIGSQPLDVIAQGDDDPFPGTIWIARRSGGDIVILTPGNTGPGEPSPGERDGDGVPDVTDLFSVDPHNGTRTILPSGGELVWDFSLGGTTEIPGPTEDFYTGVGFDGLGVGFSGIMLDGVKTPEQLYDPNNLRAGAAIGVFQIIAMPEGDARPDTQLNGFQFGVNHAQALAYTFSTEMANPFFSAEPGDFQSQGIFIGRGDQDNYIKLVAAANGGPGFEVTYEEAGSVVFHQVYRAAAGDPTIFDVTDNAQTIGLSLEVDKITGLAKPHWSYTVDGVLYAGEGAAVQLAGQTLAAARGQTIVNGKSFATAMGVIGSSDGPGEPFSAIWNQLRVEDTTPPGARRFTFALVDANTDLVLDADLLDGVQGLDAADLALPLAVAAYAAVPGGISGSVALTLTGPSGTFTRTETAAPYAVFGDTNGDFAGRVLQPGQYAFSATNAGLTESVIFTLAAEDVPPKVSVLDATVGEEDHSVSVIFRTDRAVPAGQTVTVNFEVVAGSATPLEDFTNASFEGGVFTGSVDIVGGATEATLEIEILQDTLIEGNEIFAVNITSVAGANATVADGSAMVTIIDDDMPNSAPVISTPAALGAPENQTTVVTVAATDADNDPITYSITGGADAAKFAINPQTGALSFLAAPDFETPSDADGNGIYEIIVGASDGVATTTKALSVALTDVAEGGNRFVFRLINAATDTVIDADLSNGVQGLDAAGLASPLAVAAFAAVPGSVSGSVALTLVGPSGTFKKTETTAPYAVFGDANGDFAGKVLQPGQYTFSASNAGLTESVVFALQPGPAINDDDAVTEANTPLRLDVLANDSVDLTAGTLSIVGGPVNGTAQILNGEILYTPNAGFTGAESFSYGFAGGTAAVNIDVRVPAPATASAAEQLHLAWVDDTATTLTVVWRLDAGLSATEVQYRAAGDAGWTADQSALRLSGTKGGELHEATLSGLAPNTEYEFRVRLDDGSWSKIYDASTAPEPGQAAFNAVFFADTGLIGRTDGLTTGTAQAIAEIAALDPTLLLGGGDYIYFDTDKRFGDLNATIDAWFDQWAEPLSQAPFMTTYGNHEVLLGEGFAPWRARFPQPEEGSLNGGQFYSFDVAGVHFVSILLPVESTSLSQAALDWIQADILAAQAAGASWVVPYMHAAPYSGGTNHPDALAARNQLAPLFESLGIDLVLTTHDQSYQRTYPLVNGSSVRSASTNVPTSTDPNTYFTETDGVVWMKVSPTGKLSNISGGFSPWAETPAPTYVATRDNTVHHFAELDFDPAGILTVKTYGFDGSGAAPVLVDSFRFIQGERPTFVRSDSATTPEDAATLIDVLFNDDPGTVIQSVGAPAHGTASLQSGRILYTPAPDFNGSDTFTYTATNPGGGTATTSVSVTVTPVKDAPIISTPAALGAPENQTAVVTVAATDADNDPVTYSITGGADSAKFGINAQTGALSFLVAPDFETPADADGNGVYEVVVGASDGQATTTKALAVTVTDVAEGGGRFVFRLIDAATDTVIDADLSNGVQGLGAAGLASPLAVAAFAAVPGSVSGSVALTLVGPSGIFKKTETTAPYAVFGDTNSDFDGKVLQTGQYTFSAANAGLTESVTFMLQAAPQVSVLDASVSEAAGSATVTFRMDTAVPAGQTVTVDFEIVAGTATPQSDYATALPFVGGVYAGSVQIAGGATSSAVAVDILPDDLDEGNETFAVNIVGVSGAGVTVAEGSAVVNIVDDDMPNSAPVISTPAALGAPENQTEVVTVGATDADLDPITFSIEGGADAAAFGINPQTGALSFLTAPDLETPADADGNGVYEVVVGASDGEAKTTKALSVTVTDVLEAGERFVFRLIDATTDTVIDADLSDGVQGLDPAGLASPLAVAAYAAVPGSISGPVVLSLTGPSGSFSKTETAAPYAIFGDMNGDFAGRVLQEGQYSFSATNAGLTDTVQFMVETADLI